METNVNTLRVTASKYITDFREIHHESVKAAQRMKTLVEAEHTHTQTFSLFGVRLILFLFVLFAANN